jgi:hypothetical protein
VDEARVLQGCSASEQEDYEFKMTEENILMPVKPSSSSSLKSFLRGSIRLFPFATFCMQTANFLRNAVILLCKCKELELV